MARRYTLTDLALLKSDLGAKLPEPQARKKRGDPEGEMQRQLVKWWDNSCVGFGIPHWMLFAIPNGAALGFGKEDYQIRNRGIRGRLLKLGGLRPGVCDLMLAVPKQLNYRETSAHGLFLELKTPKGVVSDEQKQFIHDLRNQGYRVEVCRSLEEAVNAIKEYLT